jgi:hypothetical protein
LGKKICHFIHDFHPHWIARLGLPDTNGEHDQLGQLLIVGQDQQSIFSWHVHPAEQHGHGGRTTPVFPPRQKRSVKCAHRGQKRVLTHMQNVHFCVILFSKGVLMDHLCTKGIKMTPKCS